MGSEHDHPLLSVDDVLKIIADRDEAVARVEALNRKVDAIRTLLGDEVFANLAGPAQPQELPSFRAVIQAEVEKSPHGVTYEQLREALRREGLTEALERSPNNFFNAVARLQRLGTAAKLGDRLIAPKALENMPVEIRRHLEEESEEDRRGAPAAVLKVLEEADKALNAGETISRVTHSYPEIKPSRVYAALSRLTKTDQITRDATGRYAIKGRAQADQQPPESLF